MSGVKKIIEIDESRIEHFHRHLGYIRCWIAGFEAAGKSGPHAADALRQIQNILGEAKPAKADPKTAKSKPPVPA